MENTHSHPERRIRPSSAAAYRKEAPRPVSRASTTSIHSHDDDVNHTARGSFRGHQGEAQPARFPLPSQSRELGALEAALLSINNPDAAHANLNGGYGEPSHQSHEMMYQDTGMQQDHMEHFAQSNAHFAGFPSVQSQPYPAQASMPIPQGLDDKKKKGTSSSATNDRELREMLRANEGRSLKEVAAEVVKAERTNKAERTKQLFAMLWLRENCHKAKSSVPRNRVYSNYTNCCGTERVVTLNPASFGKLVRVIFPGIQTRRLGVRGESKYHYVDLALKDDDQQSFSNGEHIRKNSVSQRSRQASYPSGTPRMSVDAAVFPSHDQTNMPTTATTTSTARTRKAERSSCQVFVDLETPLLDTVGLPSTYSQPLAFGYDCQPFDKESGLELPDIHKYISSRTDPDTINALLGSYRSHCVSLIDAVRYCKEKQFFRLFHQLNGTFTVPVMKLFQHPETAPWIRECDWHMYQQMIKTIAHIALQAVPPQVTTCLYSISTKLCAHIVKTIGHVPTHTLQARLEPAAIFSHLLRRLCRTNNAAHGAANFLKAEENRDAMWKDWTRCVNAKRIMESELLPATAYEEVHRMLHQDVLALLQPSKSAMELSGQLGLYSEYNNRLESSSDEGLQDGTVQRLSDFILALPSRFPQANAKTIVTYLSKLTTAAIRDVTLEGGTSYSHWWITKVAVDEMSMWYASLGGFLSHEPFEQKPPSPEMPSVPSFDNFSNAGTETTSRYSSMGTNFAPADSGFTNNGEDPFSAVAPSGNTNFDQSFPNDTFSMDHDDSGIAMLDDVDMHKYQSHAAHTQFPAHAING